jgi:methylenetetrahydromethanopterin dehydrogenase
MRTAALVADDAREIEKYGDNVTRKPHYDDGSHLMKKRLIEKPEKLK